MKEPVTTSTVRLFSALAKEYFGILRRANGTYLGARKSGHATRRLLPCHRAFASITCKIFSDSCDVYVRHVKRKMTSLRVVFIVTMSREAH